MDRLQSVIVYECDWLGQGLKLLNRFLEECDLDVIESTVMAPGKFVGLLASTKSEIQKTKKIWNDMKSQAEFNYIEPVWIDELPREILDAMYNLNDTRIEGALLIVQIPSLPKIFSVASEVLKTGGVKIVEMRNYRSNPAACVMSFSGNEGTLKSVQLHLQQHDDIVTELIPRLSERFLQFYNLSGET